MAFKPHIDLEKHLLVFGLTPLESKIYLYLINRSAQTALEISRALRIARTSVYDNLNSLIEDGLVERIITYKSHQFRAYSYEILTQILDSNKTKLDEQQKSYEYIKNVIQTTDPPDILTTQVRYYHGSSGLRQMMWNALEAKKEIIGYSVMGRKKIVGRKFLTRFLEEFARRNLVDRVIINPNKTTLSYVHDGTVYISGKRENREHIRIINENKLAITGDTTIYNNIFAVMYWTHGEIVGAEIENVDLVSLQKSIFENLWRQAIPFKKYK